MRGQRDMCLLCRYGLKPISKTFTKATQSANAKRLASSRARSREPYVLPRLVIDLDAADNKLVKRFEDTEEDVIDASSQDEYVQVKRVRSSERAHGHQEGRVQTRKKTPQSLRTMTVTPPDFLSYALQGDPNAFPTAKNRLLRTLFKYKAVHPLDNAHTKIQQLTRDFKTDLPENLTVAGFMEGNEEAILRQIETCHNFQTFQRTISMISSTQEGCEFLARNGSSVAKGIQKCRKLQETRSGGGLEVSLYMVLRLLNNLHRSMESKGVEFGRSLCNLGLYYASKDFVLPAVKMYLDIAQQNAYPTDRFTGMAVKRMYHNYLFRHISYKDRSKMRDVELRRHETLKLITGWGEGSMPRPEEQRKTCFALLSDQDHSPRPLNDSFYPKYIAGLGELGLSDALWLEWNSKDQSWPRMVRDNLYVQGRAHMFALAFLFARDSNRALSALESISVSRNEGHFGGSDKLVEDGNKVPRGWFSCIQGMIYDHYWYQRLKPTEKLWNMVKEEISKFPDEPKEALKVLENFLAVGYLKPGDQGDRVLRDVDWAELDGEEGLLVMPKRGDIPQYFRPASWTIPRPAESAAV
jgi:hypothetical protein